ncbi:lipopolysaccharide transport periplasmic protein LptA [Zoogloea sp.]|uniref:lipopolysaccharide transport periplasmic protein LptA n=1 Tax=Zoogloea sp. TaxID=49181 RepID=UPI00263212CF|nr:lipopolysaccharide transport periplasmic protein LptA [Zoogloea sp.]MDD3354946.1 lipopolysaccharide transport periplasmic protein LptA [Zoogloea sp.]
MKSVSRLFLSAAILSLTLGGASPAQAERADRNKPVNIEADKVTVDDKNKIHIFQGRVQLTQGTLTIRSDKLIVSQDLEGYQRGIATGGEGGLARFRQKREGKNEWVEGEGERIEHDARSELSQFFQRARVRSGDDEVRGQYIQFNGLTETYLVTNGPNATTIPSQQGRVQVTLQPKKKEAPPAP